MRTRLLKTAALSTAKLSIAVAMLSACSPLLDKPDSAVIPPLESLFEQPLADATREQQAQFIWSNFIDSPELNTLIDEAVNNNYDLQVSAARWRAVQQQVNIAKSAKMPTLDFGLEGRRDGAESSLTGNTLTSTTVSGILSASWEIDLWGGIALGEKSALNSALQQAELLYWAKLSLSAQFAKTWLDTIEAKQQWLLSQRREKTLQDSLDIIEHGFKTGFREAIDVYSARAELANNQSNTVARKRSFKALSRQLSVLLGRYPNTATELPLSMPVLRSSVPAVLSLQLLERRPDLKAAAYAVVAQQAKVGIATAKRLPSLNIRGAYGASNNNLHDVLKADDILWNIAAGLAAPLFHGGRLIAEQNQQAELLQASIADYKRTVLIALQEVEQNLENEALLLEQRLSLRDASIISQQTQRQAFEAYIAGIANMNTWLQAQRTAFDRTSQLIALESQIQKNRIDLYLALGGGF